MEIIFVFKAAEYIKSSADWKAYIFLIFVKDLIVLAEGRQKYDGSDILKTVDPFLPLWTLATHIHHPRDTWFR